MAVAGRMDVQEREVTYGLATAAWRLALEAATAHALAHDAASEDVGDQGSRERAFGAFVWLVNLGALASAGALAAGAGLRLAVAVQALMMAAAALAAAGLLPHAHPAAQPGGSAGRGFRDVPYTCGCWRSRTHR